MQDFAVGFVGILSSLNRALSSAVVILAFSLLIYILTHNLRSSVARSFSALIACVCITYAGDVALYETSSFESAMPWLRFQWIGIAFTPAAYLHFSDALLRTTNSWSTTRRWVVRAGYLLGLALLPLAFWTDLLVRDGLYYPGITQFRAGPLFWIFAVYFFASVMWGAYNTGQARRRCLTSTSLRRMTYLALSFIAPALGVFPYMLVASAPSPAFLSQAAFFSVMAVGNLGVALMIAVMAYSVAFFGVLTPDRVVRHNFVHFLLRGPFVATLVIFVFLAMPKISRFLGLPRDMVLVTAVVFVIVVGQLAISLVRPRLDRLIFRRDRAEIEWIQELDRRLLTTTDLQQALENILAAVCELLRAGTGFIANLDTRAEPRLETHVGSLEAVEKALANLNVAEMANVNGRDARGGVGFIRQGDFLYLPLRTQARDVILGLLALEAPAQQVELSDEDSKALAALVRQAELALEDRALQQDVFMVLRRMIPDLEQVQRMRGAVRYAGSPGLEAMAVDSSVDPEFTRQVRAALSHYWGGPQLTQSPLINLNVVQEAMGQYDGNPVRALRAILSQAIENLRPDGERRMTAAEWLLYNILELRFVQGLRVRDIAERLALSESDLYRKQRLAIEQVARALAEMEKNRRPRADLF